MGRINYQQLLDNSLKTVVKDALTYAQFNGLGDDTHFYITFLTRAPNVVIPDFLRMRYPEIMTIVLQHSFNNLNVSDKEFGVQLTFDGRPFFIRVPFEAMLEFKDPSADFILTFDGAKPRAAGNDLELPFAPRAEPSLGLGKIVSLDEYRKNKAV